MFVKELYCSNYKNSRIILNNLWLVKAFLIAQLVKNLPAMQETLVGFLGHEELLEKG